MIDEKTIAEIRAAHEAEEHIEPGGAALFAWAKKVHEHRGILLDAITEMQSERAGFADQIAELTRDVEHEALRARKAEQQANDRPSRPRVGPWVEEDGESKRFDDHGFQVGEVWGGDEDGFEWLAQRAGMPPARGLDMSRAAACAAADAVLATWADLDGVAVAVAVADTLSQARALLQRARSAQSLSWTESAETSRLRAEIDAFLAEDSAAAGTSPDGDDAPDPLPDLLLDFSVVVSRWLRERDPKRHAEASALHEKIACVLPESNPRRQAVDTLRRMLDEAPPVPRRVWTEEQIRRAARKADEQAFERGAGPATTDEIMRELQEGGS